jgi:outer membrane lipoprotein-sorting protein
MLQPAISLEKWMPIRLLLLLLPLLLTACVPRPVAPPVGAPPVAAAMLFERLADNATAFASLQGMARVRVRTDDRTQSVNEVLLAQKPDRLRLETLSPFGQPLLVMATDGEQIDLLVPGEGKLYRDEYSLERLQRLTRLPLQLTDLVHLLLYQVPVIGHTHQTVAPVAEGETLLTLFADGGRRQELRFDRLLRLTDAAYFRDDELLLRVGYDRFNGETPPFPMTASLAMPASKTEATVAYSEVRTNVAIPSERFRLTPPRGVEVLPFP